jgi:hypothetical protein
MRGKDAGGAPRRRGPAAVRPGRSGLSRVAVLARVPQRWLPPAAGRSLRSRTVKRLHRPDLYGWSRFDESRDLDFHAVLWVRPGGNVAIDPLPLSPHDAAHLSSLGGVALVVVTNSDHVRDAAGLARASRARVAGPAAERDGFPLPCDLWLADGDEPVPGLRVLAVEGSKTPGELALVLDRTTLVTGDLVRAHEGGRLATLPEAKLRDRAAAAASVRRLASLPGIDAVLVGDGWPIFRRGGEALRELAEAFGADS